MKKYLYLICILSILLFSCIKQGTVVKKYYNPPYTEIRTETYIVNKVPVTRTYPVDHSEEFIIVIEGYNKKEKLRKRKFYISGDEYSNIEIGDYYIRER